MTEIYPIGGGKGGVGKSFIAASLGTLIAQQGHNVVVIDLDLGASNLHTLLAMKNPKHGLNRYLDKTVKRLESEAVPTIIPNLFFISSLHCSMEVANLLHAHKLKIISAIQKLPFDYIFLDLGTGTNFNTLDFFLTSKEGILVGTPEPTSIENFFRFINAVYLRILKQTLKRAEFLSAVKDAVTEMSGPTAGTHDILKIVSKYHPDKVAHLKNKLREFEFKLILNQFRKNMDSSLGNQIETVCNRHFHSNFQFVGTIRYDEQIHDAVFSKTLYVQKYPHTQSSDDLKKIAEKITKNRKPIVLPKEIS